MNLDERYQTPNGLVYTVEDILDDGRIIFSTDTSDVVLRKIPVSWKKLDG